WESAKARIVPKPRQLPAAKRYIRADPKTLLCYIHFLLGMTQQRFDDKFDDMISLERCGRHIVARFSDNWASQRERIVSTVKRRHAEFHRNIVKETKTDCSVHLFEEPAPSSKRLQLPNGETISWP